MKRVNNEVMLGAFIVGAGGLLAYMSVAVGGFNMTPGVHVSAKFSNASGLVKDASVSIAGVEVGHVEGLSVEHDKAVVKLFLNKEAHVRADVVAAVRAKSLLGEKYVELLPQGTSAPELKSGDAIENTRSAVEVDELLGAIGPLIKQVNPADVATIVHTVAKTLNSEQGSLTATMRNAAEISGQVNDLLAANRQNVDKIAANVASLTTEGNSLLKAKRPELERTVANADRVAATLAAEAPGLAKRASHIAANVDAVTTDLKAQTPVLVKTLERMPATLDSANRTLGKVDPLLDKANAFNAAQMRELANDLLLKTGVRVYMHPFVPGDAGEFKKIPQKP